MKYFIDTEFHEHQKPVKFLGITIRKIWTIDLISIGIVREDGTEYYAINGDLDFKYAKKDKWLSDNVLSKLPSRESLDWQPMNQIARDILIFCLADDNSPKFYGYFSDYDWVVFCWIFGRMLDLPKGFPMYCIDLKQMMVERELNSDWKRRHCPDPEKEHNALEDAHWNRKLYNKIVKIKP